MAQLGLQALAGYGSSSSSSSSSDSDGDSGSDSEATRRDKAHKRLKAANGGVSPVKLESVDKLFETVETQILNDHSRKMADVAAATNVPKSSWSTGLQDGSVRKQFITVVRHQRFIDLS